jgi:hypothetical protein
MSPLLILFLVILTMLAGYGVSRSGRPINAIRFNIHKFLALGAVILAGVQLYPLLKAGDYPALLPILVIVLALLVIALFAGGAVLSRPGPEKPQLRLAHAILAYAALAALSGVVYLLW